MPSGPLISKAPNMFSGRKTQHLDHDQQAKPNIMKFFGNRFKKAFKTAKKAIQHRGQRRLHDSVVISSPDVLAKSEDARDSSVEDIVTILPHIEHPPVASNSEFIVEPNDISAITQEQVQLQPPEEQEPFRFRETGGFRGSVINTKLEDHPQEDLHTSATSQQKIAPEQQPQIEELRERPTPDSNEEDFLDSDLDDDEDVANCLLSTSEIDLRARNWANKEHENAAPLNVHSLARFTGIRGIDVQNLFEELRDTEPRLERKIDANCTHGVGFIQQDCRTSGAIDSPLQTPAGIQIYTEQTTEADDGSSDAGAPDGWLGQSASDNHASDISEKDSIIVNRTCGRQQALTLVGNSIGSVQSPNASMRCIADTSTRFIEACHSDKEDSDSDLGSGVIISGTDYNLGTKHSDAGLGASNSTELTEESSPATNISNKYLGDGIVPSWSDLQVVKRTQRRSAPCEIDLTHERSDSQSTLVNQGSATPSPLESHFPICRPSAPKHLVSGKKFIDELELAIRVQQAIKDTKDATDREWESVVTAAEQRHDNEMEDLREEHEAAMNDLQEQHQDQLKKVRKSHGDKMKDLRGELARAKLETKSVEETLDNTSIERDALRDELRQKDGQLKRVVAAAQALQGNNDILNRQHPIEIDELNGSQSLENGSATGSAPNKSAQWEQETTQLTDTINQLRDDLSQCQQARDCYIEKFERYYQALISTSERRSLQGLEEEITERTTQLRDCQAALEEELRAHRADREMFFNQVAIMGASVRRSELDVKAMEVSRKAALKANENSVRLMRRAVTDNEMDAAVWEQYRILERDYDELRQNAKGHEYRMREKDEEIVALKADILRLELEGPKDQERIQQLEAEVQQVRFDYDTAVQERDVAVQDQEKREPELWKSIGDRPLKQKDEKIAHLEKELQAHAANKESSNPRTRSNFKHAGGHDGLATPPRNSSPAMFGKEEATFSRYSTPSLQEYSPGPLFGHQQATKLEDFATPDHGTPESNTSFF